MAMRFRAEFDVIVVGGGHAGTEAALAAARMGASTLLLTHNIETLGQMSCNPAIGGIGKGHLVKEIDALGGAMALAADRAGIQFRTLNASKGPAVRATRAQADRQLYKRAMRRALESQPNLQLFQQEVADLTLQGERVAGCVTQSGIEFRARSVVLTVGTFLGGRIHVGLQSHAGGRAGDPPANHLAARLRELPLRVARLKTGTPPRIDGRSVDYAGLREQHSDDPRPVFSYLGTRAQHPRQLPCHITATNERTHDIIRAATARSPMFTGMIEGVGPRYCPSVEDKVVRFADRTSHQIFIEPEGLDTHEIYPNGISTSLPFDVQYEFVRTIKGFERAHITRPGYAIEYDFFDPRDLKYEPGKQIHPGAVFRRADQRHHRLRRGRRAGPARGCQRRAGLRRARSVVPQAQRGLSRGAGRRSDHARSAGAVSDVHEPRRVSPLAARGQRGSALDRPRPRVSDWSMTRAGNFSSASATPSTPRSPACPRSPCIRRTWMPALLAKLGQPLPREAQALELLRRPELDYDDLRMVAAPDDSSPLDAWRADERLAEQVEQQVAYRRNIPAISNGRARRSTANSATRSSSCRPISTMREVGGLSNEARQCLCAVRPQTLGQAARIPGLTPAAVSLLLVYLKKRAHAA